MLNELAIYWHGQYNDMYSYIVIITLLPTHMHVNNSRSTAH